jgi:hypothetical protein
MGGKKVHDSAKLIFISSGIKGVWRRGILSKMVVAVISHTVTVLTFSTPSDSERELEFYLWVSSKCLSAMDQELLQYVVLGYKLASTYLISHIRFKLRTLAAWRPLADTIALSKKSDLGYKQPGPSYP